MRKVTRRLILASGTITVATAALGGVSYFGCRLASSDDVARLSLLDVLLDDIRDAIGAGEAARAQFGIPLLERAAFDDPRIRASLKIDCDVTRKARLKEACREDFRDVRLSLCNRFVLSQTEIIVAGLRT